MIKISDKHKDVFRQLSSRKEFPGLVDYIKVQINNIGVLEWVRTDSLDPQLAIKKAKFEGKIEGLKELLTAFEIANKKEKEEDE